METKTKELIDAKNALKEYLKQHNLSPLKDWRNDKKHGKAVTALVNKLNLERDKVLAQYPFKDIDNIKKLLRMAKKNDKKATVKKVAKPAEAPEKKAPKTSAAKKYDYPLVDGKEMTSAQKKKYRAEQRRAANGKSTKSEKPVKTEKKATKKVEAAPAPVKKAKKVKKVKKDED